MDSGGNATGERSPPARVRQRAHDRHGARLLPALVLVALSGPLLAGELTVRDARIEWVPGLMPNRAFFELVNDTDEPVTLIGARSEAFAHVRFKAAPDNDIFMLESLEMPLVLGPAETLELHPDGPYLFLHVKSGMMDPADTAIIELLFAEREPLAVEFTVRK